MKPQQVVLVVAGSDPSGGAGLELDLKVLALFGIHGVAVASCLTLQTATGLRAVTAGAPRPAQRQLDALVRDTAIGAVKIGMLPDARWVKLAATTLDRLPAAAAVYDPVMAPTLGPRVLPRRVLELVRRELLPRVELLTPNAIEAAELLDLPLAEVARDPDAAARALLALGPRAVLLKGGHLPATRLVVDRLRGAAVERDYSIRRRPGVAPRGTGCALSTAVACGLLRGLPLDRAIARARSWLARARAAAVIVGRGRPYLGLVTAPRAV